ncbi:MAG: type I restriction-modification system subunit M [Paludibacter sp.]|nr:type I restriction-modification system subunit M [Bacteroidales bacterium]MCM1069020.1 type I restriction-modification system subunit M [Prevotella sp.]MCM1353683.1 type I restriction-modification system subunit M [Bacteroides sp.]MCM1441968.1 type I restriction-modification system subunit M [Muribaculum sp.]MCM1481576.1 type I restriction-modification system subunit M [Paludibacter sp.]
MAKKTTKETILNIDDILFKCRDILRNARNSGSFFEKRDLMLTLIFLRFIGEKYDEGVLALRNKLIAEGLNPDDPDIFAAFFLDASFADGTFPLPEESRWSTLINKPAAELNVALDTALKQIATDVPELRGCFVEGTFTTRNLAPNDIKKLVDEINKISHKQFGTHRDLIGYVYEYFLKEFAVNATKEEGEFYTPHDIVKLIATCIQPFEGTIYDPCCGSGGMFVQSTDIIKAKQGDISRVNIYGQEKEPATYRLAKMNLALRGISHNLGAEAENTFAKDLHKGLYFDYIMTNPPFNLKGWYNDNLATDPRWAQFALPPESNANYAWILHMLSHLKPTSGVAGFLLANGALGDNDGTAPLIRRQLLEQDRVEAIIVLPRELFITTDISVTLWILNMNKQGDNTLRNRTGEVLFMDLRSWTAPEYNNAVKNQQKKKFALTDTQIERAAAIYHTWQQTGIDGTHYAEPELYRSVGIEEIARNNYSLVPSRYIEFVDRDAHIDYDTTLREAARSVSDLLHRHEDNIQHIKDAFNALGYECK